MKSVALVTYKDKPHLIDGEKLLLKAFQNQGVIPHEVPWDKVGVNWKNFDLVILRTCWNYHTKISQFLAWLDLLENQKIKVFNPINIIKWNINKRYLLDLEKMGIPIVPTLMLNKETIRDLMKIIYQAGWKEVIIKPTIGASSYKIVRIKTEALRHLKGNQLALSEAEADSFQVEESDKSKVTGSIKEILKDSDLIIQPFLTEIQTEGEYSFIFFNKIYSHTILKKPKRGEFRTQPELGGTEIAINPDPDLLIQAKNIMEKIPFPLLYARVDCVVINEKLHLMELELTEPYLYFEKKAGAAENFVRAALVSV